jgi:L-lactate dehydrogenase complex protein LldG
MSSRERFLERVRSAVAAGNRLGGVTDLPSRGDCGYQGGGPDLAARFCTELAAAGGKAYRAANVAGAMDHVLAIVQDRKLIRVLIGTGSLIESLQLPAHLREVGIEPILVADLDEGNGAENFFIADLSITGVDYLIAETGSLVYLSRADEPRSASLLPPVHVVIAHAQQLLPDLFDLFERLPPAAVALPGCVSIITGPSKTGDIELKLVTGVHGPGEVHVILLQ